MSTTGTTGTAAQKVPESSRVPQLPRIRGSHRA